MKLDSIPFRRAFTLIELLAVLAVIGTFLGVLGVMLRGRGSESVGLEAAQSIVASSFTLVRSQAAVSGQTGALMVFNDPADPERYLRFVVPAVDESGTWAAVSEGFFLPPGCFVVPRNGPAANAIEGGSNWGADPAVQSTALQGAGDVAIDDLTAAPQPWIWMTITPRGSTANSGDIVLATGRANPPGADAPFTFTNPENVRGIGISAYGQFTLLNNRNDL